MIHDRDNEEFAAMDQPEPPAARNASLKPVRTVTTHSIASPRSSA